MNRGLRKEWALVAGLGSLAFFFRKKPLIAMLLGGVAANFALLPAKTYSLSGKTIIITGGSRGLGLALARLCLQENAQVVLLARDAEELDHACTQLEQETQGRVLAIPCDVTHPDALQQVFAQVESYFGHIDILINNAGSIAVGPFKSMTPEDFEAQFRLHVHAVIHAIQLAMSAFQRVGEGRIVNICSIGGALSVPHMSTYCSSKFALAGLSETLASELAALNIKVTTVYPGLMRTGSPIQAVFKGNHEKEYAWFATGDVMPGVSVSAETAAQKIITGLKNGDAQVRYPTVTTVGMVGHAVFPETYALLMRQVARFMPPGTSTIRKTGADSRSWLDKQFWYKPLQRIEKKAGRRLNQIEKMDADYNLGIGSSINHPLPIQVGD